MPIIKILYCILIGYLLGSLNPAALLSKLKKKDLRKEGTGNLGATNTMMVFGKRCGAAVMIFDVAKAFVSVKLAQGLFPAFFASGMISGAAAVTGHIFPFYLKFKGGKGLAAFGGLILGVDPLLFAILVVSSLVMMFIINYSAAAPITAALLFPTLYALRVEDGVSIVMAAAVGVLIICKHFGNAVKARRGEDIKVREYVRENLLTKNAHKN